MKAKQVKPSLLIWNPVLRELQIIGSVRRGGKEDDVAVFVEKVEDFEGKEHPYFKKSYSLMIAKLEDFEPAEHAIFLDWKGEGNMDIDCYVPETILSDIVFYAKKLADAIDRLFFYVSLEKLPKEEDLCRGDVDE